MSKTLVLIVPGMLALPAESIAAMHSLATLARYAGAPAFEARGTAAALFKALGVPDATPVAPVALLGAGADPAGDYVLCADPVHLVVDRDTVVLAHTIDDVSEDDAAMLVKMLDRHFAGDDLRFEAVRPDAWFARRLHAPDIVTTPVDAARGRRLLASLPRGAEGGTWQRWQNEIEMLLHEHPVNSAREARGEATVSGAWFWGGGRLAGVGAMPLTVATASPGRLGDLARGIAVYGRGAIATPQPGEDLSQTMTRASAFAAAHRGDPIVVLVVLPAVADSSMLEANWLAPAIDQLDRHRIDALHVIADGNGNTATWTANAPAFWQRIAARTARRPFEMPRAPDT
jgi:hypothetical protein